SGCGEHQVAGLGFQGSVSKVGARAVPRYFVMLGGGAGEARTTFGRLAAKVPARRVPEAVTRLVALYTSERAAGESALAFFRRIDVARVKGGLAGPRGLTQAA